MITITEYEIAMRNIEVLMDKDPLSPEEQIEFENLVQLAEAFEHEHYPIEPLGAINE
jgi:antitoxin component HigA of HigAB toxin-antitoxin module